MWDERSQARWNELSAQRQGPGLTAAEQQEWEELRERLEADEWEQIRPAVQRLQAENEALDQACEAVEQEQEQLRALVAQRRGENERLRRRLLALEREYEVLTAEHPRPQTAVTPG